MSDVVRITNLPEPSSKELIAYKLYLDVMTAEDKNIHAAVGNPSRPDRKYLLDLYVACIRATDGLR